MGNGSSSAGRSPRSPESPEPIFPRDDPDDKGDHSECHKLSEAGDYLPGQTPTEPGPCPVDSIPPYSLSRHPKLQPVNLCEAMNSWRDSLSSTGSGFSGCGGDNQENSSSCSLNRSIWSRGKRLTSAETQELNAAADALLKEIGDDVTASKVKETDSVDVEAILEEILSPPPTPKGASTKRPGTANPTTELVTSLKGRHVIGQPQRTSPLPLSTQPLLEKVENTRREPKVPFDASKFRAANQVQRPPPFFIEVKEKEKLDSESNDKENETNASSFSEFLEEIMDQ